MTKENAFEEYKKDTGYKDLSAVSAVAAFYAGYEARDEETCEWLWDFDNLIHITACGFQDRIKNKYCPYCGGQVVAK